jgi:predicted acetyltransferase
MGGMKVRQVRSDEREQIAQIYNNTFRVTMEMGRGWAKGTQLKNTRAIFEGKRLVSMLQIVPYTLWIGGKILDMGGIGGVATWADCQGKGYASTLMKDSLVQMRKRKQWVSALYPFSYRYYGKFGWAIAGHRVKYKEFKQHEVPVYPEHKMVSAVSNAENYTVLDRVYRRMAERYNLCAKRSQKDWKARVDRLKKDNGQVYVIKDGKEYIGWFFCQNIREGYFNISLTNDFAYTNDTSLRAMMGFLATLPTNVKKITVVAPYDVDLWHYFKEPYIQTEFKNEFQFRVVDFEKAVKSRGYTPDTKGKITIQIADKYAQWNEGTWTIEVNDGKAISVAKGNKKPDVVCDIQTFSQLFCGYTKAEQLAWQGRLKVKSEKTFRMLNRLFHDKPTLMLEWF